MNKNRVTVIYDRKKEVPKVGRGKVEIRIYLGYGVRKYVTVNTCNPFAVCSPALTESNVSCYRFS